jgi:mRNA interferase RelE/StbE
LYELRFKKSVKKDLKKIGEAESIRILRAIREKLLAYPAGVGKPLKGGEGDIWCFRVGNYRILYNIDNNQLVVLIIKIGHRRDVYQDKA